MTEPLELTSGSVVWERARTPRDLMTTARWFFGLGCVGLTMGLSDRSAMVGVSGSIALLGSVILAFVALVLSLLRSPAPGGVAGDAKSIVVTRGDERRTVPRAKVASAIAATRTVSGNMALATVEILLDDGDRVVVHADDEACAQRAVDRLGFGERGRRALHQVGPLSVPMQLGIAVGASLVALAATTALVQGRDGEMAGLLFAALALGLDVLVRRALTAPDVIVGDDAIVLVSRNSRNVIATAMIAGVTSDASGKVLVQTTDGGVVTIGSRVSDPIRALALAQAIEQRMRGRGGRVAAGAFARNGKTVSQWIGALRGMSTSGYRAPGLSLDDAEVVVATPSATTEERLGAAVALAGAGRPLAQVRVAVDAFVDEPTRLLFEEVAKGHVDEERVARVLARAK